MPMPTLGHAIEDINIAFSQRFSNATRNMRGLQARYSGFAMSADDARRQPAFCISEARRERPRPAEF